MQEASEGRISPSRRVRAIFLEIAEQPDEPCGDRVNLCESIGLAGYVEIEMSGEFMKEDGG
jgi:hypothetical protein